MVKSNRKPRETKGGKKLLLIFSDLKKNKPFLREIKELRKRNDYKFLPRLATKYGIPYDHSDPIDPLWIYFKTGKWGKPSSKKFEMARIRETKDEHLYEHCIPFPKFKKKEEALKFIKEEWGWLKKTKTENENYLSTYPVRIDVHRFASKRDFLDFIESKWNEVEELLSFYWDNDKPKRIRQRSNVERADFIWKNRKMNKKKLAKLVNEKFSGRYLGYEDIGKIISLEKKRRLGKIA